MASLLETFGLPRLLAFSLLATVLTLASMVLLTESLVRLVMPQELSGTWRVPSSRGHLVNKAGGSALHREADRQVEYRFNEHHLRGGPIGEGRRVLALGDSFTFGWLLDEDESYVARIAARADQRFGAAAFEFLNGGAGGWGTSDYLAFLEEFGPSIDPDVVLVFLNFDDINRSANSPLYTLAADGLGFETHSIETSPVKSLVNAIPGYAWLLEHSHAVQLLRRTTVANLKQAGVARAVDPGRYADQDPADRLLAKALFARLARWCAANDAKLLVFTTGYHDWYAGRSSWADRSFHDEAERFFSEAGIVYEDLTPLVSTAADSYQDFVIADGVHPNERGSELIAEAAWRSLAPQLEAIHRGAAQPSSTGPLDSR